MGTAFKLLACAGSLTDHSIMGVERASWPLYQTSLAASTKTNHAANAGTATFRTGLSQCSAGGFLLEAISCVAVGESSIGTDAMPADWLRSPVLPGFNPDISPSD